MDETEPSHYWCHMCSQRVNPIINIDIIQCPICHSGFIEEMPPQVNSNSSSSISLGPTEFNRELESVLERRRRNSATILRLLWEMRAGLQSSSEPGNNSDNHENGEIRNRERVLLINPYTQTIFVQSSNDHEPTRLDLLLQRLFENDPNRYGTAPAKSEAVEALLNVRLEEVILCSICLDECEVGVEVKEMPCKHKFHGECILPWLKLHSSCPVCRYQLPFEELKVSSSDNNNSSGEDRNGSRRQHFRWPFSGLFSSGSSSTSRDANGSGGEDGN